MKYVDILKSFELEINQIDDIMDKPVTDDSLYWLNQAVSKFVKTRFNGDIVHNTSYEQTEKRRKDLISLFKSKTYESNNIVLKTVNPQYMKYQVEYPKDFLYVLNEDVVISNNNGGNLFDTCVFECTQDSFMYRITNSLTDFHYNFGKARPLRIRYSDGCYLLTDKNYKIHKYELGYIRKPNTITLDNPFEEYTDFDDITMVEIIKIAALMYIENKKNDRYNTITQEVSTQE